jgi:hypothetical protein
MIRRGVAAAAVAFFAAGCSSSTSTSGFSSPLTSAPAPGPSATANPTQAYLDQVNALCDALLPKVLAATHGGHDAPYPVHTYYAEEPAHAKARDGFDAQLAKVVVPSEAAAQHTALANYVRFANRIDAARATAARKGQRAFDAEITHERTVDLNSPVISALESAGFTDSCVAR